VFRLPLKSLTESLGFAQRRKTIAAKIKAQQFFGKMAATRRLADASERWPA